MELSKSALAIILSRLLRTQVQNIRLEQYPTPSELAAELLWEAMMHDDIANKTILDAGCGTGILGLGALLLGAKKVYFVDVCEKSLTVAKENYALLQKDYEIGDAAFMLLDITDFTEKAYTVLQNPPFGTKTKHADKDFLEKAFQVGHVVYSIHKITSQEFIEALCNDRNFAITHLHKKKFPLPQTQKFHRRRFYNVDVGIWRIVRL